MDLPSDHPTTRWTLIARLRGPQDEEAWRVFLSRYQPFLAAVLRSALREPRQAEAALADFWGYLFGSRVFERVDPGRRFRPFLAGVARNFARQWRRDQAVVAASPLPEAVGPPADAGLEREDLLRWSRQLVALAMTELRQRSAEQADALTWFYGLDPAESRVLSAAEIGVRQGRTTNAVHQTLLRGRECLRGLLLAEVRKSVDGDRDLDDEWRLVLGVLAQSTPGLVES